MVIAEPNSTESLPMLVVELLPAPPAKPATTTLTLALGEVPLPSGCPYFVFSRLLPADRSTELALRVLLAPTSRVALL